MDAHESNQQAVSSEADAPAPLSYLSPWRPLRRLSLEGAAVVACRALALWALIQVLDALTYSVLMLIAAMVSSPVRTLQYGLSSQLIVLPRLLVFTAIAALLWFKAPWLAWRITRLIPADEAPAGPGNTHDQTTPLQDATPLLGILLIAVGVLVLAEAAPELARAISTLLFAGTKDDSGGWLSGMASEYFWPGTIKCAIGTWLLLGSGGIARLVLKLRTRDPVPTQALADPADPADGPL